MRILLSLTNLDLGGAQMFVMRLAEEFITQGHEVFVFNHQPEWSNKDFQSSFSKLDPAQRQQLIELLSSCDPRDFKHLSLKTADVALHKTLRFYVPLSKKVEAAIWEKQKKRKESMIPLIPEDERVEDAGLQDEPVLPLMEETYSRFGGATV